MNSGQWYVLVEETCGYGQGLSWGVTQMRPAADHEQALMLAHQVAAHYVPGHPMRPRSRSLFRGQDGGWLVWVQGKTMNFHFRVTVMEYYGNFPGNPSA